RVRRRCQGSYGATLTTMPRGGESRNNLKFCCPDSNGGPFPVPLSKEQNCRIFPRVRYGEPWPITKSPVEKLFLPWPAHWAPVLARAIQPPAVSSTSSALVDIPTILRLGAVPPWPATPRVVTTSRSSI